MQRLRRLATLTTAVALVVMMGSAARAEVWAHFPLNDGEGFEAQNLAEGGEPGYIFDYDIGGLADDGSVWVDDPERGTVLGLNGTTAWVEAGFIPVMDLENDFSWSFWARQPPEQNAPANDIIIGNRWGENGSDTTPREFIKFTPNRFEIHYNSEFENDFPYADSDIPSNNRWIYNSVVKDGDELSYYRNGLLRNSREIPDNQVGEDNLPLFFGGGFGGSLGWRGQLSDMQLYTSALTPEQLQVTMGGDLAPGADLYAHYPMNDGAGDLLLGSGPGYVEDGAFIENSDGGESGGSGPGRSVWREDEERGTVLSLRGAYVDAGELPVMDLENDFTWTFWSQSNPSQAAPNGNIIVGNDAGFGGEQTYFRITADQVEYQISEEGNADMQYGPVEAEDIIIPNNDEWIHHVAVKDGDQMAYYRNGLATNSTTLVSGQRTTEPLPFALGGQAAPDEAGRETWIGYLSEVILFDHALSAGEVAELAGIEIEVPGDCNGDGVLDNGDLDCMTADTRDDTLAALGLPLGDLNGDGIVDFPDFLTLSGNFNTMGGYTAGDLDLSGTIDFPDFLALSGNFGAGEALASVPEPTAALLLSFGVCGLGMLRRRRR